MRDHGFPESGWAEGRLIRKRCDEEERTIDMDEVEV